MEVSQVKRGRVEKVLYREESPGKGLQDKEPGPAGEIQELQSNQRGEQLRGYTERWFQRGNQVRWWSLRWSNSLWDILMESSAIFILLILNFLSLPLSSLESIGLIFTASGCKILKLQLSNTNSPDLFLDLLLILVQLCFPWCPPLVSFYGFWSLLFPGLISLWNNSSVMTPWLSRFWHLPFLNAALHRQSLGNSPSMDPIVLKINKMKFKLLAPKSQ